MNITRHALERLQERKGFTGCINDRALLPIIFKDIKKSKTQIFYSKAKDSYMIEGNYYKYIIKDNTLLTVYVKKKNLKTEEKKQFKKMYNYMDLKWGKLTDSEKNNIFQTKIDLSNYLITETYENNIY